MTHREKRLKTIGANFGAFFVRKIRSSNKSFVQSSLKQIFRAKFTLQTCHLNVLSSFLGLNLCAAWPIAVLLFFPCFCQSQRSHGLTWLKSKGLSVTGLRACSVLRSLSTVIASSLKIGFHPPFDLGVFFSLPLRDFGFSSLVIVIVKNIPIFDMVAEQPDSGPGSFATSCPVLSGHDDSTTRPTNQITSSSGEEDRRWSSRLQDEPDIKMFSSDPKLNPRLPSPTTFDGVKPSYVEWSEEILTFLSVTDYQEFVPVLQAVIGHKDVITKKIFIEGVLSEIIEEIKKLNQDLEAVSSGARVVDDQDAEVERLKGEIKTLEEKKDSRVLTLLRADNFLRYVLLHSTSGDPNVMVRRIMRTTSSDSEIVAGLEIWRQMAVTYAGSAQTRVVTLLKQIMTPSEWNPEKSSNVLQQYHHWLELISKYESLSSEKIAPSIKITLALQNVRGPLANALSLSITEKSTWNDIHNLLINYFNNSITTDSKEIYQFDISGKVSKEDSMNQVGKKGKGTSKKSKGHSKGKGSSQNQPQKRKGKSKGQSKGKTKSKGKGQWTTWSGQSWSWNQNQGQGQGGKGKGKGHQVCSHCGRKGHSVDQCWWAQKTSSSGTSSDQRQVYNISAQPGDHSVAVMPTDQLRGFQDLRPLHQQQSINQPYYSQPSSSSAVSSVFASGQGQGSVDIIFESIISHQMLQKTTSWRSTSATPSMTSAHHCLKNVKNLGQHS